MCVYVVAKKLKINNVKLKNNESINNQGISIFKLILYLHC